MRRQKKLDKNNIAQLVDWLTLKDDKVRYQAFLLLQSRAMLYNDVYPFWDIFREKLGSDNSYQRSIGLMLIAENARWDTQNKTEETIDDYLALLNDEKPITIRQCIQSLEKIIAAKPQLSDKIASGLISFDIMTVKETMRKSVLNDILNVLFIIRKNRKTNEIENFFLSALSGGILDKDSKKHFKSLIQNSQVINK